MVDFENAGIKLIVLDEIVEIDKKYGVKKVILFGSRARGMDSVWRNLRIMCLISKCCREQKMYPFRTMLSLKTSFAYGK